MSDAELTAMIQQSQSITEVLRKCGFLRGDTRAHKYIRGYATTHSLTDCLCQYKRTKHLYTTEDVKAAVFASYCISDVIRALGLQDHGNNFKTIKRIIVEHNIDISHFSKSIVRDRVKSKYTFDQIFCVNSMYMRNSLQKAVVKYNLLHYMCQPCGNTGMWLGREMRLVLDHINGINNDNRVDNLRFLCHNCHSLTETYAGKKQQEDISVRRLVWSMALALGARKT